jgi:hypothetical protein
LVPFFVTNFRIKPYMPYLNFSPSAWVLPLKFDGGGYRAGGKAMFDSEGNLWVGDNFTVGWQAQDALWQGNATKFNPNGKPLSPITTGFAGGGMQGGTFGTAVDANDNAWLANYGGKSIAVFEKSGKPLTPPEGITFNGRLGLMQGIIATPSGDVWALGVSKRQVLLFPKGDWTKGQIVCEGDSAEPCKSFTAPFHLAIDQQNRIWVSDSSDHVFRFPAADPSKVDSFKVGYNNSGLNIDSQGNVWVTNRFGYGGGASEGRRARVGHGLHGSDHVEAEGRERQCHAAAAGRHASSGLALHWRWSARTVGCDHRRQRQCVDFQLRRRNQSNRRALRHPHWELPAGHEDRRPDLAARRVRGWRATDANRSRDLTLGRCMGDEQLAGHRELLR